MPMQVVSALYEVQSETAIERTLLKQTETVNKNRNVTIIG